MVAKRDAVTEETKMRDARIADYNKYGLKLDVSGLNAVGETLASLNEMLKGHPGAVIERIEANGWILELAVMGDGQRAELEYVIKKMYRKEFSREAAARLS